MDLIDIFQNLRIKGAEHSASDAKSHARSNAVSLRELQDQIDHLSMVCMALGELLEEVGFDKTRLMSKIEEIDLRDGKLDGKYTPNHKCVECNRQIAPRHLRCMYCGTRVVSL